MHLKKYFFGTERQNLKSSGTDFKKLDFVNK